MPRKGLIIGLFVAFSILGATGAELESQLKKHRAELASLGREKASVVDILDGINREKSLIADLIIDLEKRETTITAELGVLADSLQKANSRLDSAIVIQEKVVRAMFMNGRSEDAAFLLGGTNFNDFVRRMNLLQYLARERRFYSQEVDRNARLVGRLVDSTEALLDSVKSVRTKRSAERDSLGKAEKRHKETLAQITKDEGAYRAAIARMEESLAELARRLPEPAMKGDFARKKGAIPWPSRSKRVIHSFGIVSEKRFGTTFKNSGIDIATDPDEIVSAVADGRVAQIYWLRAYGKIVIVEHGDGFFTVYGNLGEIDVTQNQSLSAGQRIGRTAPDGWLEGAKLHFEIRHGRQEVNPLEWLVSA